MPTRHCHLRPRARVRRAPGAGRTLRVLCALVLAGAGAGARGLESDVYVLPATVVEGEREIDFHSGFGSAGPAVAREDGAGLGLGTGVTEKWFTEAVVNYARAAPSAWGWDSLEWENIVALAEPGEWPVDVGMALELEVPRESSQGIGMAFGPLLQENYRDLQLNLNLLASRYMRGGEFQTLQLEYRAQLKYRYRQPLEFGVQAFGTFSSASQTWTYGSAQAHRLGPAVLGRFLLARERSISYNAAYLVGTTAGSPERTFRLQLEYEF